MTSYQYYKSIGICPYCHKAKAVKGKTYCADCLQKKIEYNRRYCAAHPRKLTDEQRKRRNKRLRFVRQWRKDHGVCVKCGHARATSGIYCDRCREYADRYNKQYNLAHGRKPRERDYIPQPDMAGLREKAKGTRSKIEMLPEVVALWNAGWTYKQISDETMLCDATISRYLAIARGISDDAEN